MGPFITNGYDKMMLFKKYSLKNWWTPDQDTIGSEFCQETSLHGLKYFSKPKLHISERAFWLLGFLASFTAVVILINELWDKYKTSPIVTTFQASKQVTSELPFPALTLCNAKWLSVSLIEKLLRDIQNDNLQNREIKKIYGVLHFLRMDCEKTGHKANILKHIERGYDFLDTDVRDILVKYRNEVACDKFITSCRIANRLKNCTEIFRPTWTNMGMCCTFNMMPMELIFKNTDNNRTSFIEPWAWPPEVLNEWSQWNYEQPLISNPHLKYPWRQDLTGSHRGLRIRVEQTKDEQYCSSEESSGIYFALHNPNSLPLLRRSPLLVNFGQLFYFKLGMDLTVAERNLEDVSIEKRGCVFPHERMLNSFRSYTARHCRIDCFNKLYDGMCNCTRLVHANVEGIPICYTKEQIDCQLYSETYSDKSASFCRDCMPPCEDLSYSFEATFADLRENIINRNRTIVLNLFLGPDSITPRLTKQLYGITDLIANMGGILGLCLGFSILSGVEIIYHFSLHAFWKIRHRRRQTFKTRKPNTVPFVKKSKFLKSIKWKVSRKVVTKPNRVTQLTVVPSRS